MSTFSLGVTAEVSRYDRKGEGIPRYEYIAKLSIGYRQDPQNREISFKPIQDGAPAHLQQPPRQQAARRPHTSKP